ncbi:hypothetical protein MW887_011936 [Aspergillus wentii]|nr:hypothetical protein MW887_011936 [Aspergillus wentii]
MLGPKFMWGAFLCGWGIPALGTTLMLIYTGVSFRFGGTCHINIDHGLQAYWIPITVFAVAALVLQVVTMAYCIHVYVRSLFDNDTTTNSSGLPSYSASITTVTARQAYKRIRRVLQLQWRGVALVLIIIGNVIFFAVVFIKLDNAVTPNEANVKKAIPWLLCLVTTEGDRKACAKKAEVLGPNEATLLALLILLSLVGLWNFILFARPSMFVGWVDFFRSKFGKEREFISADPERYTDSRAYEMITNSTLPSLKTPEPVVRAPSPILKASPTTSEHYGRDAKYSRPPMSFSRPLPASPQGRDWDPKSTFAPSHSRDPSGA